MHPRKTWILFALLMIISLVPAKTDAQNLADAQYFDQQQLEEELKSATSPHDRIVSMIRLFFHHRAHSEPRNKQAAERLEKEMEIEAHQSGNPSLVAMVMSYRAVIAYGRSENTQALDIIGQLARYAKVHRLKDYEAIAKMREATYYARSRANYSKANECINECLALMQGQPDTLQIDLRIAIAESYNNMNQMATSLKYSFETLDLCWKLKDFNRVARCEFQIANSYRYLKDYDKSNVHLQAALSAIKKASYNRYEPRLYTSLARNFTLSGQWNLAEHYTNEAFSAARRVKGSKRMFNQITGELVVAMIESRNAALLQRFLQQYRPYFYIAPSLLFTDHYTLAAAHQILGRQDSAALYLQWAEEVKSQTTSGGDYFRFLAAAGRINLSRKNFGKAEQYYLEGLSRGLKQGNSELLAEFADSLKHIATLTERFVEALRYDRILDSLRREEALRNGEDEVMRQEVASLEAQKLREQKEEELRKNQRNNLQYLGITAGIVALFILLLLMGIYRVSAKTVRILGFFSFLLFFEFIFLIFKKKIAVITGGEPLKDLGFMVALAALMVPLHHWAEHKAIHYLTHQKLRFARKQKEVGIKEHPDVEYAEAGALSDKSY